MRLTVFVALFLYSNLTTGTGGYNILGIFPLPLKSHHIIFDSLMLELAERGHNVTTYTTSPKSYSVRNFVNVSLKECFQLAENVFDMEL
jgi:hypothetical protein